MFWIYASNPARFEQSFRDMASCVKIAGRQDPKANIFELVHDWLRDSKHQWLHVLDNVDESNSCVETAARVPPPLRARLHARYDAEH